MTAAEAFLDVTGANGSGRPATGAFGATSAAISVSFSAADFAPLAAGPHVFLIRGRDAVGNWGPTATAAFTLDRTGPSISSASGTPTPSQGGASVAIAATAVDLASAGGPSPIVAAEWFEGADPGAGRGTPMVAADGAFGGTTEAVTGSVATAGRSDGEHLLWLRARDGAGNWGTTTPLGLAITPADGIFADGFESGTTGAWTSTSGGSRVAVTPVAAAAGQLGLAVTVVGMAGGYVRDGTPANLTAYRARFTFAPNGTTTPGGGVQDVFVGPHREAPRSSACSTGGWGAVCPCGRAWRAAAGPPPPPGSQSRTPRRFSSWHGRAGGAPGSTCSSMGSSARRSPASTPARTRSTRFA